MFSFAKSSNFTIFFGLMFFQIQISSGVFSGIAINTTGENIMETIFILVIGMLIGWHIPQPTWVKTLMSYLGTKLKDYFFPPKAE
jgi:uncharacterized membrane protein